MADRMASIHLDTDIYTCGGGSRPGRWCRMMCQALILILLRGAHRSHRQLHAEFRSHGRGINDWSRWRAEVVMPVPRGVRKSGLPWSCL